MGSSGRRACRQPLGIGSQRKYCIKPVVTDPKPILVCLSTMIFHEFQNSVQTKVSPNHPSRLSILFLSHRKNVFSASRSDHSSLSLYSRRFGYRRQGLLRRLHRGEQCTGASVFFGRKWGESLRQFYFAVATTR